MYIAQQMGEWIAALLAQHTTEETQTASGVRLVLTRPGQGILQIEEQTPGVCWRVGYLLYTAAGLLAPEPEIWFWTDSGAWIPYAVRRSISGYAAYAEVSPDGRALLITDVTGQAALALHADWLATSLRRGEWFAVTDSSGFAAAPSHPSALQQWVAAVAQKHAIDLADPEAYVQLTMPARADCLVIQRVGPYVSVARYLVGDDRFTPDPEMLVRMHTHKGWSPTEIIYSWDEWQAFMSLIK